MAAMMFDCVVADARRAASREMRPSLREAVIAAFG